MVRLGYFDPPASSSYRSLTFDDVSTPQAEALALKAAEEGIVLLKNDGTLPLSLSSDGNTTIAVVGSWANATEDMQGTYSGIALYLHSPLYALQQVPNVNAVYAEGSGFPTTDDWDEALTAVSSADIVIVASGINIDQESEENDRVSIGWTAGQIDLISQFASMGKPTILMQMGTSLDNSPWLNNPNISAILWGGYPGQAGGDALLNIVMGKTAPAGRLPITQYPAHYAQDVPMTDMGLRPNATSGNPGRTYKWYDEAVLPFGYGLHYTNFSVNLASPANNSFDVSNLLSSCDIATHKHLDLCPFTSLSASVTNIGSRTSDYVALAFITGQYGPEPYPIKQLVAYERVFNITAGETKSAVLNMTLGSLARYDEMGNMAIYPGNYAVIIDLEPNESMTWNFSVTGEMGVLEEWPQPPLSRSGR